MRQTKNTAAGRLRTLLVPLCGSLLIAFGCAARQPARSFSELQERVRPGNTVYVTDSNGSEIKGKIVEVSTDALTLDVGGLRRPMDRAVVRQVQRYGDSLWSGFFIGVGVAAPSVLISDPKRGGEVRAGQRVLAVGIMGALGAGIDALIRRRHSVYLAPDNLPQTPLQSPLNARP